MRALIAEDDFINRRVMQLFLSGYGKCDVADNSATAIAMFKEALTNRKPYNLVCLDGVLQGKNSQELLKEIRKVEAAHAVLGRDGARIVYISADASKNNIVEAYKNQCDAFMMKPFKKRELIRFMNENGLVSPDTPAKR